MQCHTNKMTNKMTQRDTVSNVGLERTSMSFNSEINKLNLIKENTEYSRQL